jgi:molecular chaperone HtpG
VEQSMEEIALLKYIQEKNPIYYGRILDIRSKIKDWLSLIPATFPDYTRHTIEHSDEVIRQLSKLLFENDDSTKPVVRLSSVEVYILIASAYLHDVGMVVSEKEKADLLKTEEWQQFTSDGQAGAKRWQAIEAFRKGSVPEDECQRNFIADVQTRFLVAELIRRTHHLRAADILSQHEIGLGMFGFGDPVLRETISNVCVGHGLSRHELIDNERFPERRDIRNETVNVRFLALLLRIGDLLDMSSDRACPMLLNVVCSIPSDSLAHWTKYQRITHRLTAPDVIEIHALCQNQDEHRFLNDWCQWLVDEVKEAGNLMSRSLRHTSWRPPETSLEGEGKTIRIEPAREANYIPSTWRFVLDENTVFERLVNDVYDHPLAFIRELVQNALDASRCQLYLELRDKGLSQPEFPTQVDEDLREKYPINVILRTEMIENELSGSKEEYQILTVEDQGIGMDRNIIENYLLQVGRSYYTTEDCRRTFKFIPTSRFGIGFLSVFAVSDAVKIETYKPSSKTCDGPLKLILSGPRNYLLTEKGTRKKPGTRIDVLLRKPLELGFLAKAVSNWCKRVEFPVIVRDLGKETIVKAERAEDIEFEIPLDVKDKTLVKLVAFPVKEYGVEGEIYIVSVIEKKHERWDEIRWFKYDFPVMYPAAQSAGLPENIICFNGVVVSMHGYAPSNFTYRLDVRRKMQDLPLSRSLNRRFLRKNDEFVDIANSCLQKALLKHLETSKLARSRRGWLYKNNLSSIFEELPLWNTLPETVKVTYKGKSLLVSLDGIRKEPIVTLIVQNSFIDKSLIKHFGKNKSVKKEDINNFAISYRDAISLSSLFSKSIFDERKCSSIKRVVGGLAMDWVKYDQDNDEYPFTNRDFTEFNSPYLIGFGIMDLSYRTLFNPENPLIKWLLRLKDACKKETNGLKFEQFKRTYKVFENFVDFSLIESENMTQCLMGWQKVPNIPSDLKPPFTEVKADMGSVVSKGLGGRNWLRARRLRILRRSQAKRAKEVKKGNKKP